LKPFIVPYYFPLLYPVEATARRFSLGPEKAGASACPSELALFKPWAGFPEDWPSVKYKGRMNKYFKLSEIFVTERTLPEATTVEVVILATATNAKRKMIALFMVKIDRMRKLQEAREDRV